MKTRKVVRYSESFKLKVVKEYEKGELSMSQIRDKYGIFGGYTVSRWIQRYGSPSLQTKVIRIEMPGERNKLKELEAEVRKLKELLADAHVRNVTNENFLSCAADRLGISVDELKKKTGKE